MFGFQFSESNGVKYFRHQGLGIVLKLLPNGQSSFCLTNNHSKVVYAPKPQVTLLGDIYQPEWLNLAYSAPEYHQNALHELIHLWFSWITAHKLSPNHAHLMEIAVNPVELCDWEEIVVTGFQVYVNTGVMPERTLEALEGYNISNLCEQVKPFCHWITNCCK